jgi:palmitoyltransferase ZDHHC1/11
MLFIITFTLNLFVINFFLNFTEDYVLYSEIAFMTIMFGFYISLVCQRPKNYPRDLDTFLDEFNERSIKKVCFVCRNRNPRRGYHCDSCGVCIEQYDHHCTWINNCVGKRNIARFVIFIIMLVFSLAFVGLTAVLASYALLYDDPTIFQQHFTFRFSYTDNLERYCLLGCFLINEVTAVFLLPVFLLCVVQIKNLLTNKTTFENIRSPT